MSSRRSRKCPPACLAARQPSSAERTWPRCRYPVGLGAKRVTTVLLGRSSTKLTRSKLLRRPNYCGGERRSVTAISGIGYASRPDAVASHKRGPPMPMDLSGPSRAPVAGGRPHGLGADGDDLIGLQQYWGRLVPEAEFVAPNAPFPCDTVPFGYQWFSVRDRSPAAALAGVRAAATLLDAFIDNELEKRGLDESATALVGFSQGTMMALFVGLRRERPLAGILGYSGRLIAPALLPGELRSGAPVLLIHGTEDSLVPFEALAAAEAALQQAGVPVETLACVGTPHAIDPEGLERGGRFLLEALSAPRP